MSRPHKAIFAIPDCMAALRAAFPMHRPDATLLIVWVSRSHVLRPEVIRVICADGV